MIRMSVLYPNRPGARFDFDYYLDRHIPMVQRLLTPLGTVGVEVDRGVGGGAGLEAPFVGVAHLLFSSLDAMGQAMAKHQAEIVADIPRYTDIEPQIQISETSTR
jgi:uncharacterized protein (TIGR02118 family)